MTSLLDRIALFSFAIVGAMFFTFAACEGRVGFSAAFAALAYAGAVGALLTMRRDQAGRG